MKTVKEILTENRESVISSIKYTFKVYSVSEIKEKMIEFLNYAEKNADITLLNTSKKVKTELKNMVSRMAYVQNYSQKSVKRMKLADIMTGINELEEESGNIWNPLLKTYVRNENAFSSTSK